MPVFSSGELNRKPPKLDSEAPHYLQSTSRGANRALQIIRPVFKFNDAVQLGSKHILNQTGAEASSPRRRHGMVRRQPLVWSPLLRHAFGRRVGRQGDPGVTRFLPHRDARRGEIGVGEVADGNGDVSRKALALPKYG
jgi:hypothetical protein